MINTNSVEIAIRSYHHQVEVLKSTDVWSDKERILALLRKRDRIQSFIDQQVKHPNRPSIPTFLVAELSKDDAIVGNWETELAYIPELSTWKKTINPPAHHWWWFPRYRLEPSNRPIETWVKYAATVALLILTLLIWQGMLSRLLENAPDIWKTLGKVITATTGIVIAGGPFTKLGKQTLQKLFKSYRSHSRLSTTLVSVSATFFLLATLLYLKGLPLLAAAHNWRGMNLFIAGDTLNAQSLFKGALRIDPKLAQANHNLALTYEELDMLEPAVSEYLNAVRSGFLPSINNLARLKIVEEQAYDEAVVLISRALRVLESDEDIELEYSFKKNLGWARLEQGRLQESFNNLIEAQRLEKQLTSGRPDAYCLLAQVYERQEKSADAKSEWQACLSKISRPEDDFWKNMADEKL